MHVSQLVLRNFFFAVSSNRAYAEIDAWAWALPTLQKRRGPHSSSNKRSNTASQGFEQSVVIEPTRCCYGIVQRWTYCNQKVFIIPRSWQLLLGKDRWTPEFDVIRGTHAQQKVGKFLVASHVRYRLGDGVRIGYDWSCSPLNFVLHSFVGSLC